MNVVVTVADVVPFFGEVVLDVVLVGVIDVHNTRKHTHLLKLYVLFQDTRIGLSLYASPSSTEHQGFQ